MIYVHYSKWGISLTVQKEEPGPLTQKEVEQTIMSAIDLSLENGENPYDQTKKSVHIPADTRSAFPVISVQSPVSIQYCWQS